MDKYAKVNIVPKHKLSAMSMFLMIFFFYGSLSSIPTSVFYTSDEIWFTLHQYIRPLHFAITHVWIAFVHRIMEPNRNSTPTLITAIVFSTYNKSIVNEPPTLKPVESQANIKYA